MTASSVSIANRALQILGSAEPISSLSENAPNARSMTRVYEPLRQALLRSYRWGFAIRRASLAADGDETVWGELKKFYLPNDYLRILREKDPQIDFDYRKDWKIEGDETGMHIVSDESAPLDIKYISDVTDPSRMDSLFREALSTYMASQSCQEITGSTTKKADIDRDLNRILAEAKKAGAIEEDPTVALEDDWLLVRL